VFSILPVKKEKGFLRKSMIETGRNNNAVI
jgi:hypothetical protein